VPTLRLSHLSETERRAYVIADNKLALNAGWDQEMLAIELQGLIDLDFDVELTGFSLAEVDLERGEWKPTGGQTLEGSWTKTGRVMVAKCAEARRHLEPNRGCSPEAY
jgi:hypothetical protein